MRPEENQRFEFLKAGSCVPTSYVWEFYGISWPLRDPLAQDFNIWRQRSKRRECAPEMVSRYEIEGFLQQNRLASPKWMAAALGMTHESLDAVLGQLAVLGLRPNRYQPYEELISEDLADDLIRALPGQRFTTFADPSSFFARLHDELSEALHIEVQALWCATSQRMQDTPRQYGRYFDCVTLEPLSVKHLVWLDFKKPLVLSPDRCSKLFFAENYDEMARYRAGTADPADLAVYQEFLAGNRHA